MNSFQRRPPKLGIVGGLGALAGADLLFRLVQATPVQSEEDHREIFFEQRPLHEAQLPSDSNYSPTSRKFHVFDALAKMEREGCDVALLPCFISHTFLDELRSELGIHIVDMMQAISEYVGALDSPLKEIGVVTTPYVRQSGLFENALPGTRVVYPSRHLEDVLLEAIYGKHGLKSGYRNEKVIAPIEIILRDFQAQGINYIVPGMTEIPLLLSLLNVPETLTLLDTSALYTKRALLESDTTRHKAFKIGVLGGVGPAATVDFLDKVVSNTKSIRDQDHVKVLVEQNPQIPDRTENLTGQGVDPSIALYSTAKKLEHGGADIIAIPCNTAHAYVERIQRHLDIPIVSILTETTDYIVRQHPGVSRVGILATNGTIASGIYQEALNQAGLNSIVPDSKNQVLVTASIYGPKGVKAGYTKGLCREQLLQTVNHLVAQGAEAVILGCTELPLIAPTPDKLDTVMFDPTLLLAKKCVELASFGSKNRVQISGHS